MQIVLKRIKRTAFDDIRDTVIETFHNTGLIDIDEKVLEDNSEIVLLKDGRVEIDYSVEKYEEIVNSEMQTYEKLSNIGMLLHKETKGIDGRVIPKNILSEKEVWAYLSLKVFKDIIKDLRLDDDSKINDDKIERFYFNEGSASKLSRTGLLFIWMMIDSLDSEDDTKMSTTAFHFIDPVKAIFERTMARNPIVLKAYVQAIINNDCDARIKNKKYKVKVPNNISCFSRINILDAYEYSSLVDILTKQIKDILTSV